MRRQTGISAFLLALTCCAGPLTMSASHAVPGASGEVSTSKANNGGTQFTVKVAHLAQPEKVTSTASSYVVWVQAADHSAAPANVGSFKVGDNLEGEFTSLSALPAFEVLVTAEADTKVAAPTMQPLLQVRVDAPK